MTVHCSSAGQEHMNDGFRVRYLGSIHFPSKTKKVNMKSLQQPLLDLYTKARKRGEDHRGVHFLALTQHLHLSDYGLVVAENEKNMKTRCQEAVVIKVITPVAGLILWTAVRFHTRILKKKRSGAAFVPLACSDTVFEKDCYVHLAEKRRFLIGLTHPPLFACLFRRVGLPQFVECHAFVCANIEDAMIICSSLDSIKNTCERTGSLSFPVEDGSSNPTLHATETFSNKLNVVIPELSLVNHYSRNKDKMADHKIITPQRRNDETNITAFKKYYENKERGRPGSNNRNIKYGHQGFSEKGGAVVSSGPHHGRKYEEEYNRSLSCEKLEHISALKAQNKRSKSCGVLVDDHFSSINRSNVPFSNNVYRTSSTFISDQERSCDDTTVVKNGTPFTRQQILKSRSKSSSKINQINDSSSSENTRNVKINCRDRNMTKMKRFHSCNRLENGFSSSPNSSEIHCFKPATQVNSGPFKINSTTSGYGNNGISIYYNKHGIPERAIKKVGAKRDGEDISVQTKAKKTVNLDEDILPEEERKYIWQTIQQHTVYGRNLKNNSPEKHGNKVSYFPSSQDCTVEDISINTVENKKNAVTSMQTTNVENEFDSQYSSDTTVEDYSLDYRHRSYENNKNSIDSRLERFTSSYSSDYYSHSSDGMERPKERPCKINTTQIPINKLTDNFDSQIMFHTEASMQEKRFDESQVRKPNKEVMEMSKTMSFSSESEYSYSGVESNSDNNKEHINEVLINGNLTTGHVNPKWEHREKDGKLRNCHSEQHLYIEESTVKEPKTKSPGNKNWPNMSSGENIKLTIKVPYQRNSWTERNDLMPNGKTYFLPHGVRSYNRFNKVKNWSTLSEASNSTSQNTVTCEGVTMVPISETSRRHHKSIRFSPDVNLQGRPSFLKNLKRFSVNSFNRAKNKLNSFKSKVKNHKSKQDSDLSEDSAYDTSEVCHNPQGNRVTEIRKKKNDHRSSSYQDLSSNSPSTNSLKHQTSALSGSVPQTITCKDRRVKTHHKTRHGAKCGGASDSGVEENSSDCSEDVVHHSPTLDSQLNQEVVLVNGVRQGEFRHWSYTSLKDELGYMP